jgi:hypothetical protein
VARREIEPDVEVAHEIVAALATQIAMR